MVVLNILPALFIMAAMFTPGKQRLQVALALAAAVAAPAVNGAISGVEGIVFSLAGGALALVFTMPLSLFGHISRTDVLVSVALAGMLGAVQYAAVFGIAFVFLVVQRLFKIESGPAAGLGRADREGAGLLALNEQSALVEIEAMKILRKDEKEFEELARREGYAGLDCDAPGAPSFLFPWPAKLAVATIAVLMIGSSI